MIFFHIAKLFEKGVWGRGRTSSPHTFTSGFSTIEILIAFSVGIIFLSAAIMVVFSDPTLARQISLESGQAAALDALLDSQGLASSSNKFGALMGSITENWSALIPTTDTSDSVDIYTYASPEVTDISPCVKEVLGKTTWTSLRERQHQISFGTALSNVNIAASYGRGACDPFPPGDWDNPEVTGWSVTPSSFTGTTTDMDVAILNGTSYVFISGKSDTTNEPDLMVIDITNLEYPTVVAEVDFTPYGYNKIIVVDQTAYALQNDTTNQIHILDVSNPEYPTFVGAVTIPHTNTAVGRSLFYYDDSLYVGTQYLACPSSCAVTQNNEFHVYDVTARTSPIHIKSLNINHNINDIMVSGTHAYLATSDNTGELQIVDIRLPATMVLPDDSGMKFDPSGNADGISVYALGSYVYLGRARTTNSDSDLYKIDVSDSNIPIPTKWKKLGLGTNTKVLDIIVQSDVAFLITSDPSQTFHVWDVKNDNDTIISPISTCDNTLSHSKSVALAYYQSYILVANEKDAKLDIIRDQPHVCTP
ncbi:hypothetical protein IPH92_00455 [Candidatus Kaiserbacteria bacterium]|nr:MAG: hypothetical protein IPH92_00455 [Candidatus Kaiserbacteria bacterium]